jgi:hypothetical protein
MKIHTSEFVKRFAKKLAKELGIPHHLALDKAAQQLVGAENWRHFLNRLSLSAKPRRNELKPGVLIRFKADKSLGIAISQHNGSVTYFGHCGPVCCVRNEISICRDQSQAASLKPMRLYLPYGKWNCADGTEVLFNRDYRPIWEKRPDGTVIAANPDEWIRVSKQEFCYGGLLSPDSDMATFRLCCNILKEWGVEDLQPIMLDRFRQTVATGDLSILDRPERWFSRAA